MRSWITQVAKLSVEAIQQVLVDYPDAFRATRLGDRVQLTAEPGTLRQTVQVAEGYSVEGNVDTTTKFERMKFARAELGPDDELLIEFAQG